MFPLSLIGFIIAFLVLRVILFYYIVKTLKVCGGGVLNGAI